MPSVEQKADRDEERIRLRAQSELSDRRYAHTAGVVEAAAKLAARYGEEVGKARLAAWLHDIAREWPTERLHLYAEKIELPSGFALIPALLHGPVAAHLAQEWFNIDDEDLLNAVRYHTTGRLGMSRLERIVCLADAIEVGRRYDGVEALRTLATTDLNRALAESFDQTLRHLLDRRQPIFPLTVMARNAFWDEVRLSTSKP